ncbi:hypothetical protein FGO68_gene4133 [Halteria grandinella]|uniref:Uncharacterized protein n=1 Tax=Halteria grandinella TaxID=5974 RepID=A0A8J8T9U7_HALGN|nr:hypothetical protein FGO68_gene4133 [Halteria grandinella]
MINKLQLQHQRNIERAIRRRADCQYLKRYLKAMQEQSRDVGQMNRIAEGFYMSMLSRKLILVLKTNVFQQTKEMLQTALNFREKSLKRRALVKLFVFKCKRQMRQAVFETAEMIHQEKLRELKRHYFNCLVDNWKVESFRTRKLSETAQACLYQWSIEVKLNKIGGRYVENQQATQETISRTSSSQPFDFNLTRSTDIQYERQQYSESTEMFQSQYMRDIMKLSQPKGGQKYQSMLRMSDL